MILRFHLSGLFLIFPAALLSVALLTSPAPKQEVKPGNQTAKPDPVILRVLQSDIEPALKEYCFSCHNSENASAGVNLTRLMHAQSFQSESDLWKHALGRIRGKTMPPASAKQPGDDARAKLAFTIEHLLAASATVNAEPQPGRVLIHRLNRLEYNNTVRDLFGVVSKPADKFPADGGGGGGFDNNADTLFIPPILMERYLDAAGLIIAEAPHNRLFPYLPGKARSAEQTAKSLLTLHGSRAYRHPLTNQELTRLLALYHRARKQGFNFEESMKLPLRVMLVTPKFLFRAELDHQSAKPYRISDYELASRLSYFLWASMPDETLFTLAAAGKLHNPQVLDQQVHRMLQSPKARSMAESFAGQWLKVKELYTSAQPDPGKFPDYRPVLRDAMYQETITFFHSLLRENDSILNLLDCNYTYLNEPLARHYGIEGVKGMEMRRVRLADGRRGGVVTMAGVLTLTSYPLRTSPVLRGKWVLAELLGSPTPPPPPVVATLSRNDTVEGGLTFRQRLEKHREKPECSGCHSRMDPIGFGLENYDAVGRWRSEIAGKPVDASGSLEGGVKFAGPVELKRILLTRRQEFVHNLTEKLLSYALGRGLESYDRPAVNKITAAVVKDNYRSEMLLREIVRSYPFQYRMNLRSL